MREMKDSGIEWIGEIPKEWKVRPLRSKYSFNKGLSITKADLVDEGVCVISYGQIHSKDNKGVSIRDSLIRYLPPDHRNLTETSKTHVGDFIFADTSEDLQGCGNCIYVDRDDVYAGYHTLILRPKEIGHSRYYAYLFSADAWRAQIRASVSGVKLFSITQDIFKSTAILEPPIDVQIRIVNYLDKKCSEIDALIAAKEKTNALLRERRQSIIYEAVTKGLDPNAPMKDSGVEWIGEISEGWKTVRIKHVIDRSEYGIKIGPFGSTLANRTLISGPYNVYSQANLISNSFSDTNHHIDGNTFDDLRGYEVKPGDVCVSMMGTIGKCRVVPAGITKGIMDSHLIKIRLDEEQIDPRFFEYVYDKDNSGVCYTQMQYEKKGTIMDGLNTAIVKNLVIPLPPLTDQVVISNYLDTKCAKSDALICKNGQEIRKLKEYRQSLIYEAVTGKIEV